LIAQKRLQIIVAKVGWIEERNEVSEAKPIIDFVWLKKEVGYA
jgi:hypothetical protein